jgi:zinc protease
LQQRKISITNRSKSPESNFRDSINTVYFGNNPRRKPTQVADLEKISLDRMFEIYKDRFADMGDFTFVFVGNIEQNSFRDFVKTYIASLPSKGRKEKESDPDVHENIQPIAKTIYAGKEPRVLVEMRYNALGKTKKDVPLQLAALNDVIEKRLREILREEKGATYNVSISAYTDDFPKGEEKTVLSIGFACAPEKMQEMIAATEAELRNIAQNGIAAQDLLNVQENYIRSRETSKKENSFWLGALSNVAEDRKSLKRMAGYEARVKKLSPKALQKLLQKLLEKGIKMQFVLMPKA